MFDLPNESRAPNPRTCWTNKTPFQMGLILILFIAIPFLIVLVSAYVYFGVINNQSENCTKLCNVIKHWKKYRPPSDFSDYPEMLKEPYFFVEDDPSDCKNTSSCREKREITLKNECLGEYPVGALLEKLYHDDREQILKCPVAVLSPNWVLTINQCLEKTHIGALSVRMNSDYWSQGSTVKKVEAILKFGNLSALQLEHLEDTCFTPVKIAEKFDHSTAKIFYWNDLKNRRKYQSVKSSKIKILQDENKFLGEGILGQLGAPLLDKDQILIGFQLGTTNDYEDMKEYQEWLQLLQIHF